MCPHTTECHLAVKRDKRLSHVATWKNLEDILLSEHYVLMEAIGPVTKDLIVYDSIHRKSSRTGRFIEVREVE